MRNDSRGPWWAALLGAAALGGCVDDGTWTLGEYSTPGEAADCDPIAPEYCLAPFPNDAFTERDLYTPQSLALADDAVPVSYYGATMDARAWDRVGFSRGGPIFTFMPGATDEGLPSSADIERSLQPDSPTILLDGKTGELVPHFAELDATATDPALALLFIRPAVQLAAGRRYIVALRDIVDADGRTIPPSDAFVVLRDGLPTDDPRVGARRNRYRDMFERLEDLGISRRDLQLAWDFTTASTQSTTDRLVRMRAQALAAWGAGGPPVTIDQILVDTDPRLAMTVEGSFQVPNFLDAGGDAARLIDDGVSTNGVLEPRFVLVIPRSALDQPAGLLQFGHGLLGLRTEILRPEFFDFAQNYGWAIFATDWIGLTETDQVSLGLVLESGRIEDFRSLFDRLQQSMINQLGLMRAVSRTLADHPEIGPLLDPSRRGYHGISLGGINGAVYVALSPDIQRAVLDVMGAPFSLLLLRSRQFDAFFSIARASYPDSRDVQLVLALVQQLWDRVEPIGWLDRIRDQPLPDTPAHEVLLRAAIGDHSVTNLGAHVMARSLGAPQLDTGGREIWGIDTVDAPHDGSAYVEYDFGLPPAPVCGLPMRACDDPHGNLRALPPADQQLDHFLRTGQAANFCEGGACSFPALSGCEPGEQAEPCP